MNSRHSGGGACRRSAGLVLLLLCVLLPTPTALALAAPTSSVDQTAALTMPDTATSYTAVTATAAFTPALAGRPVRIQQNDGAGWYDVANGTQDAAGQAVLTVDTGGPGTYRFRARADYYSGTPSVVSATETVLVEDPDVAPPGPVTDPRVSGASTTTLTLTWTNPSDTDFAGVLIRRKAGPTPPTSPTDGTLVVDTDAAATTYVDSALLAGRTYSYALFAHDEVPNHASELVTAIGVTDSGGASTSADWPQGRQGPEHRRWSPGETVIRPSNVGSIAEEWSTTETGAPVIAGNTLFVSGVDPDGSTQLKAYDLATGSVLWRKTTESCAGQPSVTPTTVIVSCGSIQVHQRGGSHDLLWDTTETDPGQSFVDHLVLGDTIVAWSGDRVTGYRLSDGQRRWQQLLPAGASNVIDVAASGDRVVVAYDTRLRAVSLLTGTQLWTQPVTANDVLIADGWAYTQDSTSVRRYALADGAPGWSVNPEFGVYRLLAADNNTVYVWSAVFDFGPPSPSILRALRVSDGAQKWSADVPARVGTVAITGSLVWVTSSQIYSQGRSSDLIAYHRADGARLRQASFNDNMYSGNGGVAFGGGKVVFNQGGSFGHPDPARLRIWGLAGVVPEITSKVLPLGRVGAPYSYDLSAAPAPGPVEWTVVGGSLPAGVTLSTSGELSGTPTTVGTSQVVLQAASSNGRTHRQSFPLQVVPTTSGTSWYMGGMTRARNPFSPGTGALDITAAPGIGYRWQTAPSAEPSSAANVVINGNRFYTVAGDGRLKAYNITGSTTNRAPLWSAGAGAGNAFEGPVTLADGILLVRDRQYGRLWALQASNGVKLWWSAAAIASPYVSPVVVGDTVIVGDDARRLRAYALADGTRRWRGTLTGRTGWGELSTNGARIYGVARCVLYALDATTGAEVWHTRTLAPDDNCGDSLYPQVAPIVVGNRVYAAEPFSRLIANASTGAVIDRFRGYNINGGGGVVVGGIWIYPDDAKIIARDTITGRRVWAVPVPSNVSSRAASVLATGDLVIVASASGLSGLDRLTGDLVWDGGPVEGGYNSGQREAVAIGLDRILVATSTGVRAYGPL